MREYFEADHEADDEGDEERVDRSRYTRSPEFGPFRILAEPIRRRIIEILASGESSAGEVSDVISHDYRLTRAATSWHLNILLRSGWVDVRSEENRRLYRLREDALRSLDNEVWRLRQLWERRIGTAERHDPLPEHAKQIGSPPT